MSLMFVERKSIFAYRKQAIQIKLTEIALDFKFYAGDHL